MLREIRDAIDEVVHAPATTDSLQIQAFAENAISVLATECQRVQAQANDYPMNPIRGDVWMDGAMLGPLAEALAYALKQRRLYELEEQAHTLRCMAVLAVQSHYHQIVGPAMLARAECNERLGKSDFALLLYTAVIDDFTWILDDYAESPRPLSEGDDLSLECLKYALERSLVLQPAGDRADEFRETLDRLE